MGIQETRDAIVFETNTSIPTYLADQKRNAASLCYSTIHFLT